jgi:hypothetical protein
MFVLPRSRRQSSPSTNLRKSAQSVDKEIIRRIHRFSQITNCARPQGAKSSRRRRKEPGELKTGRSSSRDRGTRDNCAIFLSERSTQHVDRSGRFPQIEITIVGQVQICGNLRNLWIEKISADYTDFRRLRAGPGRKEFHQENRRWIGIGTLIYADLHSSGFASPRHICRRGPNLDQRRSVTILCCFERTRVEMTSARGVGTC